MDNEVHWRLICIFVQAVQANGRSNKIEKCMKKIFLTIVGVLLLAGSVSAQEWPESSWAVRAGFNIANVKAKSYSTDNKLGIHLTGIYEHRLSTTIPLYLETGVGLSQKGFKCRTGTSSKKSNLWYMEIPFAFNYKFALDDGVTLYPSAGFYYALGIGGKTKEETKYDSFGSQSGLKRSDLGLRIGCTIDINRYQASMGYSIGMLDYAGKESSEMKNRSLYISVGYRF